MPRPISWITRLHEIRRAVAGSVRSHYERKEIEALFQIQPRTAQLLLETLPTVAIGRSRLVERQALADFLERIHDADDPSAELEAIRARGGVVSHKKVRSLVRRDTDPIQLDSLPANVEIIPGQVIVSFRTIEELAQSMYALARVIESDGDELASRYELREIMDDGGLGRAEFNAMMEGLARTESAEENMRCGDCRSENPKLFMVRDDLWCWHIAGPNRLCLACAEKRLGRPFEPNDFKPIPCNAWVFEALRERVPQQS